MTPRLWTHEIFHCKFKIYMIDWILPLALIISGLLFGVIGEKFIFKRLKLFAAKKHIPGSEIIFQSLQRMPFIWFVLAGFLGAIISAPLKPDIIILLQKIITIAFLYSVTLVLARLTAGFVILYTHRTEGVTASLISNVAKTAVLVLGYFNFVANGGYSNYTDNHNFRNWWYSSRFGTARHVSKFIFWFLPNYF